MCTSHIPACPLSTSLPPNVCHSAQIIWNPAAGGHFGLFVERSCIGKRLNAVCQLTLRLPVSLVVHGHDVHGDVILLMRVQACYLHPHGRKHPPEGGKETWIWGWKFLQDDSLRTERAAAVSRQIIWELNNFRGFSAHLQNLRNKQMQEHREVKESSLIWKRTNADYSYIKIQQINIRSFL